MPQNYLILILINQMKNKYFNIPVFIPELACPFQCIYCNQEKISGCSNVPSHEEIIGIIEKHLKTIPSGSHVELAYFGGNFTGIPISEQEKLLQLIQPYLKENRISGIRVSTRPDYINYEILELLKKYQVTTIELGAQSLDDQVLILSKRGHRSKDTEVAAKMIKGEGFTLGLQMMIGLPGDTLENARYTAQRIIELKANNTRIYPTLVIKGTQLESLYWKGEFSPLSLDEAVNWSKELLLIFEAGGVDVIKLGLHPSEGLLNGEELIAGPFHPSFRELVLTEIWSDLLRPFTQKEGENIEVYVTPDQINYAIGYHAKNKKMFRYKNIKFIGEPNLLGREFTIKISGEK